jgi:hypothetical protein
MDLKRMPSICIYQLNFFQNRYLSILAAVLKIQ